ncbi:MAG: HD domain-containing protein [Bacteroidales bacterium]
MKEQICDIIKQVEDRWLDKATNFLVGHFNKVFLPSHDHTHHVRTWKIARSMITEIAEYNHTIDDHLVEAVLLATLFHDTGMTVTRDPQHGEAGKYIYSKFLEGYPELTPSLNHDILRAIENHDLKEKFVYLPFTLDEPPNVLTITSIADDRDALGTIGIYRYTEIYLHREIPHKSLGIQVMQNVATRFNNFIKVSYFFPALVKSATMPYREIIAFFDLYNQQIITEPEPETTFMGHIGVVNYIRKLSVDGITRPEDFPAAMKTERAGKIINDYFKQLKSDLDATNA